MQTGIGHIHAIFGMIMRPHQNAAFLKDFPRISLISVYRIPKRRKPDNLVRRHNHTDFFKALPINVFFPAADREKRH